MKVGIIGLGRMGEGMSRRMMAAGHEVYGYRRNLKKAEEHTRKDTLADVAYGIQQLSEVLLRVYLVRLCIQSNQRLYDG